MISEEILACAQKCKIVLILIISTMSRIGSYIKLNYLQCKLLFSNLRSKLCDSWENFAFAFLSFPHVIFPVWLCGKIFSRWLQFPSVKAFTINYYSKHSSTHSIPQAPKLHWTSMTILRPIKQFISKHYLLENQVRSCRCEIVLCRLSTVGLKTCSHISRWDTLTGDTLLSHQYAVQKPFHKKSSTKCLL